MNVIVLLSGDIDDEILDKLRRIINNLDRRIDNINIITDYESISFLGPRIKKHINHHVEIIVFNDRYPEENALKIIVNKLPDIVIDLDYYNKLSFLRNIIRKMNIHVIKIGRGSK